MFWPLQQKGSTGETVRTVQYLLNAQGATLSVDGIFGPLTEAAVSAFQSAHGLVADGVVGDRTWPALIVQLASGNSGDAVRAVQSQINSRSGGWVTVNGVFGPETDEAVRAFQGPIGLTVDGVVNWYTWHALVMDYLRAQAGQSASNGLFQAWANSRPLHLHLEAARRKSFSQRKRQYRGAVLLRRSRTVPTVTY
jgi:murein L,D-transpeptidase YcbB/YkuD